MNYINQLKLADLKLVFINHCMRSGIDTPDKINKAWIKFWVDLSQKCHIIPLGKDDA